MPDDLSAEKDVFMRNLDKWRNSMATYFDLLDVFNVLKDRVYVARQKHPVFATNGFEACDVINAELGELYAAVDREPEDRQIDEAIDVAVTAIRFILGEYKESAR